MSDNTEFKNRNQEGRQLKPPPASLDLQERTLKVSNYSRKVTMPLLKELFSQGGPVKKIVYKEQFSFIEFEDAESVAYCLALFDGIKLFDSKLQLAPKISQPNTYHYLNILKNYEEMFLMNPLQWWNRFGDSTKECPKHICSYNFNNNFSNNFNNNFYNPMMIMNQMPSTSSNYPNTFNNADFRNDGRFFNDINERMESSRLDTRDQHRNRRSFDRRSRNDYNHSFERRSEKRNDRNNNDKKSFKMIRKYNPLNENKNSSTSSSKRSAQDISNQQNKRVKKHQSF